MATKAVEKVYERSTSGLRDALFDELQDLRAGIATPQEALAFAKLASQIIQVSQMEIVVERQLLARHHKNDATSSEEGTVTVYTQ